MGQADIAVIGLSTRGRHFAIHLADKGVRVAIHDRDPARTAATLAEAGPLAGRLVACPNPQALADAVKRPRAVLLLVAAGADVDAAIADVEPGLEDGDILIDGGNSHFLDTERRAAALAPLGLRYLSAGISGGDSGIRHGASILVGGNRDGYARVEPLFRAVTARGDGGRPALAHVGPAAAGHFVKSAHNGVEYADMEIVAELCGLMRAGHGLAPAAVAAILAGWSAGPAAGYLTAISAEALAATDPLTGRPLVDEIVDRADQAGTGRWTAIEALRLGTPAPAIEAAVEARALSGQSALRAAMAARFPPAPPRGAMSPDEAADYELALAAGRIIALSQAFTLLATASADRGWALPIADIARLWRTSTVLRSAILDRIADVDDAGFGCLAADPALAPLLDRALPALRRVVARALLDGRAVPALAAGLTYVDGLAARCSTAPLIQAQRDIFGAHGFAMRGRAGLHHGPWLAEPAVDEA